MKCLEVKKINNLIHTYPTGNYVEAAFTNEYGYSGRVYELTDASYNRYVEMRESGEIKTVNLVKLRGKYGERIVLFHNGPFKDRLTDEEREVLDRADVIICCYSVFLEQKLLKKCAVLSLFETSSYPEIDSRGRKVLKVYTQTKGLLPERMFKDGDTLVGQQVLDEVRKINRIRYS